MPNPTTFASARQYVGLGVELVAGQAVAPVVTMPVANFDPYDDPNFILDTSLRGSMTEPYNSVEGVNKGQFSMGGPAYFDTFGYLLSNIFGDVSYSGTYTGSGTTTLQSSSIVGATTISTVASIAATTVIQIDTGINSEVRTVASVTGAGPFTLTLSGTALQKAHASSVVVKPITAPNIQQFSTLNSGNGQPSTLTFTDFQGPTPTTGVRAYPGGCLSELNLAGTVESSAITYDAKGMTWPSASAAVFPSAPSNVVPQAAWESQIGLAGTIGTAQIKTINAYTLNIARVLQPYFTAQNSQAPYSIFRGKLSVSGTMNFVAADETPLTYMLNNTCPQFQLLISNGLVGANLLSMQIDIQQCQFNTSKINRGNPAVEYDVEFNAIATTANAGFSGGFSPCAITMQNAVAANGF